MVKVKDSEMRGQIVKNLDALCKRYNLTVKDFSEKLGMAEHAYTEIKQEEGSIPIHILVDAAKMFGITIDSLIYSDYERKDLVETKVKLFVERLKADTIAGMNVWSRLDCRTNSNGYSGFEPPNELFEYWEKEVILGEYESYSFSGWDYMSKMVKPDKQYICGDYAYKLEKDGGIVCYIVQLIYKDKVTGNTSLAYELIASKSKPICSSEHVMGLEELYQAAANSVGRPKLDNKVEIMIDGYLN